MTTTSKVVAGILVVLNWSFMGKWKWFFTDLFCYFLRFMSWESSEWPFQIEKQKNPALRSSRHYVQCYGKHCGKCPSIQYTAKHGHILESQLTCIIFYKSTETSYVYLSVDNTVRSDESFEFCTENFISRFQYLLKNSCLEVQL